MNTFNHSKPYLIAFLIGVMVIIGVITYRNYDFNQRVEAMNAHIKQLNQDGYSWEASCKIGATEAGFVPIDGEYKALKED